MNPGVLTVKNWDRFQHYGKRQPTWIKVYRALLDDHAWGHLPDASKAHLVGLWLLAAHSGGTVPCDPHWIARRIGATVPIDFQVLVTSGFISVDRDASKMLAQYASDSLASCKQVASLEEKRREEFSSSTDPNVGDSPPPTGGLSPKPTLTDQARRRREFLDAAGVPPVEVVP